VRERRSEKRERALIRLAHFLFFLFFLRAGDSRHSRK
jgi:hypothetical protein